MPVARILDMAAPLGRLFPLASARTITTAPGTAGRAATRQGVKPAQDLVEQLLRFALD